VTSAFVSMTLPSGSSLVWYPPSDDGDDLVGIGGPDEGLGMIVGFSEEAFDGGLEVDDRTEDAAFEAGVPNVSVDPLGRCANRCTNSSRGPNVMPGSFAP
jgi:hypothetical protein